MGHFGDRLGRKFMLVWSLMLMGLSTLGIGLLPTYAQIGAWAPALLIDVPLRSGVCARRRMGRRGPDVGRTRAAGPARTVRQRRRAWVCRPASCCRTSSSSSSSTVALAGAVQRRGDGGFRSSPASCSSPSACSSGLSIAESPIFADVLRRGRGAADARARRAADRRAHGAPRGRQLCRHQRARIHPARVLRDATRRAGSVSRCRRRSC